MGFSPEAYRLHHRAVILVYQREPDALATAAESPHHAKPGRDGTPARRRRYRTYLTTLTGAPSARLCVPETITWSPGLIPASTV